MEIKGERGRALDRGREWESGKEREGGRKSEREREREIMKTEEGKSDRGRYGEKVRAWEREM